MGIKYHQYGCGNDYGDDHYLTDNWNPDYDYGSQYVEVYFNINTPSYMHAKDSSAFGFASANSIHIRKIYKKGEEKYTF